MLGAFEAAHDHNARSWIGLARDQCCLNFPTFSGFGQFSLYILALGKQAHGSPFQQRIGRCQAVASSGASARAVTTSRRFAEVLPTKSSIRTGVDDRRQPRKARPPRAERRPSWRCFRPDAPRAAGPASAQAITSPGKSGARAEVDPDPRVRRQRRGAGASRRCAGSRSARASRRDQIDPGLPFQQQRRRSDRAAPMFHVKQASARARGRGPRTSRRARARYPAPCPTAVRVMPLRWPACARPARLAADMRHQQRQRRRRHAVDAAGLADGARPVRLRASAAPRSKDPACAA